MKYTTEQVIDLFNFWLDNHCGLIEDWDISFEEFLKNKEQSQLPVKDQLIWVRDVEDHNSYYGDWQQRNFCKFEDDKAACYLKGKSSKDPNPLGERVLWDEYSLTDPNL